MHSAASIDVASNGTGFDFDRGMDPFFMTLDKFWVKPPRQCASVANTKMYFHFPVYDSIILAGRPSVCNGGSFNRKLIYKNCGGEGSPISMKTEKPRSTEAVLY